MASREESAPYARRWWALAVLSLSLVVIGMDNTILNVALPTLVTDLQATASQLQWIVDGYVLVFAGLLLTMGALGDRFGRRLALNSGLVIFALASVGSAWAGSAELLIVTRGLMGIGGALIMPSTLSIITDIFPAEERGQAIAAWAAFAGFGIVIGPVVGGWLLGSFWWGSVFLINIGVIVVALTAGAFVIPESKDPDATPLDPLGAALSIAGLTALVYAIIEAPSTGWADTQTVGLLALAAVVLAGFVWWEARNPHPMLRLEFFRDPRFSVATTAIGLVFFALFGGIFVLTQHLQFVLGYDALEAGLRVTPVATLVVAAPLAERLTRRVGSRIVIASGLLVVAVGLGLLSLVTATSGYGLVAGSIALLGVGMGMTMAPATDSIMGSLPLAKAGVGSAMNDTTRQIGGALGVAVLGSILTSSYSSTITPALVGLPDGAAAAARNSIGAALQVAGQAGPAGQQLAAAARTAFVGAMNDTALVAAGVAALGAVVVAIFLPAHTRDDDHDAEADTDPGPDVAAAAASTNSRPSR